jgi:ribosomal protein L37AE/L43A
MATEKTKKTKIYTCEKCDFITHKKTDYDRHLTTRKHINSNTINVENDEMRQKTYGCETCDKTFMDRSGLWRHRQKCGETTQPETPPKVDMSVVIELLKQNQEFKDLVMEQTKQLFSQQQLLLEAVKDGKLGNNSTNCNNNNTTNNKFNLNVFLNETCKDAISMDDFINSIEVTRDEFIHTGQVGFVEGISTVMAHRFRDMDMHTRPLHCTDLKRETIYIKNADKWEKDDADKTKMRKAVRGVAKKNMKELWRWYNDNKPAVEQIGTDVCEDYFKFHKAALGGYGKEEDLKFEDKIMHNVLKEVQVDKSTSLTV